jgi:PDZ domain-containing secreted protein
VRASPAASALKVGDTVTAVDGRRLKTAADLHSTLAGRPAGQEVTLTVERARGTARVVVKTGRLPGLSGGTGIGVVVLRGVKDLEEAVRLLRAA